MLPQATLKALSSSLGYDRDSITGQMTPGIGAANLGTKVTPAKLRGALASRGLDNKGSHAKKLTALFQWELENI